MAIQSSPSWTSYLNYKAFTLLCCYITDIESAPTSVTVSSTIVAPASLASGIQISDQLTSDIPVELPGMDQSGQLSHSPLPNIPPQLSPGYRADSLPTSGSPVPPDNICPPGSESQVPPDNYATNSPPSHSAGTSEVSPLKLELSSQPLSTDCYPHEDLVPSSLRSSKGNSPLSPDDHDSLPGELPLQTDEQYSLDLLPGDLPLQSDSRSSPDFLPDGSPQPLNKGSGVDDELQGVEMLVDSADDEPDSAIAEV